VRILARNRTEETMDLVHIRAIRPGDNADIAAIVRSGLGEFGIAHAAATVELTDMARAYGGARSPYLVAIRADVILGGGGIRPLDGGPGDVCELRKMYLRPEARGNGVGRMLVEACLQAAVERNYRECYLETISTMTRAHHLYESQGFVRVSQRRGSSGGSRCNIWYNKTLASTGS